MSTLVLPFPAINPILFQWGPLAIRWYALAYIAGLIAGWALIRRVVANDGLWGGAPRPSPDSIDDLLVYCAIGVIVGGRLGNVLFYDPRYYLAHPIEIFEVWQGGMAFHGGLIGAMAGIALFARRYKTPVLSVFDLASLAAPIGIFLGRLANFIKPELWGRVTDVSWAVVFRDSQGNLFPPDGLPRHPSQIYEAGLEGLATFVILLFAVRAGALKYPGLIAGAFGALYGAARIFCEFYRDPDPRLEDLGQGLTMGMVLSVPVIVVGLGLIAWSLRGAAGGRT
jgi:phosphatidylglycerol:prolipoprotein diacylglycerol transferase